MYLPPYHRFEDRAAQYDLIDAHPLGTWVCQDGGGLIASHRPFVLDRARGDHGTLSAWIDPDDAEARAVPAGTPSLVVFLGPQAYISPGWYPGKAEHGRVVPTWNYVVVHAHGLVRWTADRAGIEIAIQRLEGKLKASQDEARPDREGTVLGLNASGSEAARTMAVLVRHALDHSPR